MNKKKTLILCASIALCAAIIAVGTFAWFSTQQTVLNNFNTQVTSGVEIVEDFDEDSAQDFKPGVEVDKKVTLVNTGDEATVARVRLEEFLQLFEATADGESVKIYNVADTSTNPTTYVPVTLTADAVNNKLIAAGFIAAGETMADATEVAAAKLPATIAATAKVYVKSTTTGSVTTYKYMAFNEVTAGTAYQPCNVTVNATDKTVIDTITYQFKNKLAAEEAIHIYADDTHIGGTDHNATVLTFNGTAVKPISAWTGTPSDCWYYDTDGWAYYGQQLVGGATSPTLLETVEIDEDASDRISGMQYKINVRLEGTQATAAAIVDLWTTGAIAAADPVPAFEVLGNNTMTAAAKTMMSVIVGETIS